MSTENVSSASKTISTILHSDVLADVESPLSVQMKKLVHADSSGVHSTNRNEYGLGVVPIIFTEDSIVSKSAYETMMSKSRTEIDFLEMITDVARLFRFKLISLERKASLHEEAVLSLIDSLNLTRYQKLLERIATHVGSLLPLNQDFNVVELFKYATEEDI